MQTNYEPHPIALEYQPLPEEELRQLAADIKANGLLQKITLYRENGGEPQILDGVQRTRACVLADVALTPEDFDEYTGDDPRGFVASKNYYRRHLTRDQKREKAKQLILAHPERSSRWIGKDAGLSHVTVEAVRREVEAESAVTNGQNDHQQDSSGPGSSSEQAPLIAEGGEPTDGSAVAPPAAAPEPPPRIGRGVTKSGEPRKAPGRKPGSGKKTDAAKTPKEVKPKPLTDARSEWIAVTSARLKSDYRSAGEDIANMLKDWHGSTEFERKILARQFVAALGFKIPDDF